jgi:DNA-binding CsgD family transcriptional regulator
MSNLITPDFFEGIPRYTSTTDDSEFSCNPEDFSSMIIEAVHIVDFQKQKFHYVADHDFFLCGHSREESLLLGYEFYDKVIHPKDISRFAEMHRAILKRLHDPDGQLVDVNYFSCTFRLKSCLLPTKGKTAYLMAYLKLKPVYTDGQLRFGICMLTVSSIKTPGNLRLYYKSNLNYEEYASGSQKWKVQQTEPLNDIQKCVLKLAIEGKNRMEIADILCVSIKTIDRERTSLFEKLGVNTMEQAITYTRNHRLIFAVNRKTSALQKSNTPKKTQRRIMTSDVLRRIQAGLDSGKSVNFLAKKEGFAESSLRRAIKQGKLRNSTKEPDKHSN